VPRVSRPGARCVASWCPALRSKATHSPAGVAE
jgi:hypothetical protein